DTLLAKISSDDITLQIEYLKALKSINSLYTYNLTSAYLDSIDTSPQIYTPAFLLEYKVRAIEILFSYNDYSYANLVFELLNRDKPKLNTTAFYLLDEIAEYSPTYEQNAKNELSLIVENNSLDLYRSRALTMLFKLYGDEVYDDAILMAEQDLEATNRRIALTKIIIPLKKANLKTFLQTRLLNEVEETIRFTIAEKFIYLFRSPHDYYFLSEYADQESSDKNKRLVGAMLEFDFKILPDTIFSINTMIDTLLSYSNQCFSNDWLRDANFRDSLLTNLNNANNFLAVSDSVNCSNKLQAFQTSVNQVYQDSAGYYPKYVSDEGYKFLFHYAQYIIDRL
ncbi:MAG: hypothetical protein KDC88_15760, partial [Ignavibacteriae bacterium]|nr:hypothetical protein [Ignavibacteriota bacterium]